MPAILPFTAANDPWLGAILGRPALRLTATGSEPGLEQRFRTERLFATAKVGADQVALLQKLQAAGGYVVDVLLGFAVAVNDARTQPSGARVRPATASDETAVRAIAETAFRYTRFHLDPAIPNSLAGRIKAEWAANFFAGRRGDAMLIAEDAQGKTQGFLLVLATTDSLVIDLIAVSPDAAGAGMGSAMIAALAEQARQQGKCELHVGTQAANAAASRFYEKAGFRLRNAQYVLHHHGIDTEYPE
jgi:ribosomal protein S18 acetylase RimI-like enzyme